MDPRDAVRSVTQVADLLDPASDANRRLAAEVDRIVGSRAAVSEVMVDRLTPLAEHLRPRAAARAQLSVLDPNVLFAGMSVWLARRRGEGTAAACARARWVALSA